MTSRFKLVARQTTAEGVLTLLRGEQRNFLLKLDGRILMNSASHLTEVALAELACEPLLGRPRPRLLIGGLGMGFTLGAALERLPDDARVTVAELNPVIVEWCRGPLAELTDSCLDDPRVCVEVADVSALIAAAARGRRQGRYDAIILDLYEGPRESNRRAGAPFYGAQALERTRAALAPGGVFAVWSEDPDRAFERRLERLRFDVRRGRPGRGGPRHVVYLATSK